LIVFCKTSSKFQILFDWLLVMYRTLRCINSVYLLPLKNNCLSKKPVLSPGSTGHFRSLWKNVSHFSSLKYYRNISLQNMLVNPLQNSTLKVCHIKSIIRIDYIYWGIWCEMIFFEYQSSHAMLLLFVLIWSDLCLESEVHQRLLTIILSCCIFSFRWYLVIDIFSCRFVSKV
jgi:hypothetical protein